MEKLMTVKINHYKVICYRISTLYSGIACYNVCQVTIYLLNIYLIKRDTMQFIIIHYILKPHTKSAASKRSFKITDIIMLFYVFMHFFEVSLSVGINYYFCRSER